MAKPKPCPTPGRHTPVPPAAQSRYLDWHEWAEEKAKTHRQERCPGCGLFKVWVPR